MPYIWEMTRMEKIIFQLKFFRFPIVITKAY